MSDQKSNRNLPLRGAFDYIMMRSWVWFLTCAVLGPVIIVCGLMVPAHLRAVDDTVLERAAIDTPVLIGHGLALVYERNLGSAQLVSQAARLRNVPGREKLEIAVTTLAKEDPGLQKHGTAEDGVAGEVFQGRSTILESTAVEPVTEFLIRIENRQKAIELLERSSSATVQQLLRFRAVTNTTLFPPSESASGQALDAALALSGLLLEQGRLNASLSNAFFQLAVGANGDGGSGPFEQALMDLMSMGQRFNWGQLTTFVGQIEDTETLRLQANLVRRAEQQLPVLFAAVQLSSNPRAVAGYLTTHGKTGMTDVGAALRFGAGGLDELLKRNQRLHFSKFEPLLVEWSLRVHWIALTVKWILYVVGGFLVAVALHFALPVAPALERPLQVRGFYFARALLFGLGSLLVVLLLSEPFLAQESQKVDFPLRLQLPTVGSAAPAGQLIKVSTFMNPEVLITMLIFFVLQALLYIACLVKLAEIRRQAVGVRMKLKLLENEEHLFDSGLYLGFLGTIISLILVSLGVFKQPSLMAAYSATSFGILFVVLFKVLHLRPARRKMLLEAEAAPLEAAAPNPFAAPL
jgi:hypothetical protein